MEPAYTVGLAVAGSGIAPGGLGAMIRRRGSGRVSRVPRRRPLAQLPLCVHCIRTGIMTESGIPLTVSLIGVGTLAGRRRKKLVVAADIVLVLLDRVNFTLGIVVAVRSWLLNQRITTIDIAPR